MNCPVCDGVKMREVEKESILIDICPSCKGVWLDRGELDKLMAGVREVREPFNQWYDERERTNAQKPVYEQRSYEQRPPSSAHYQDPRSSHYHPKYKKKKTVMDIFGDLFD